MTEDNRIPPTKPNCFGSNPGPQARAENDCLRCPVNHQCDPLDIKPHGATFPLLECMACNRGMVWIEIADDFARCCCDQCGQVFKIIPEAKIHPRAAWEKAPPVVIAEFVSRTTGAKQTFTRERGGIEKIPSAFDKQEGGMKNQPFAFVRDNNVGHAEGEAIHRLLRWREKGGIADLRKVIHTVELMIEYENAR